MPNTNGHGPKQAVLYARVSTDEQARSGYSLAQQMEALRAYAVREGYEILEEVADPGQSGASLERPGMDRVRDLVAAGEVSVVLAQDRDRFAREPAYLYLLKQEFAEHGTKLRAFNDRGGDSPEGEFFDGVLDQLAKLERAKLTERSRRGKFQKVREGKLLAAAPRPRYGFLYNARRDGYEVDEETMRVVRRIFRLFGEEGTSVHGVRDALEREGVCAPNGGKRWSRTTVRNIVLDDCYRPHTVEELEALVAPTVAACLNSDTLYGVSWWGRRRTSVKQVSENGPEGRRYRRKRKAVLKPQNEWVAVPVPDAGIPRGVVDAARAGIKDNKPCSSAGGRFWELSGGVQVCGGCGKSMTPEKRRRSPDSNSWRLYYRCSGRRGIAACATRASVRAEEVEAEVWEFVSGYLKDPDRLREGLDQMIEEERKGTRGDPEREVKVWHAKLAAVEEERRGYLRLAAKGLMTDEDLDRELAELEETRVVAQQALDHLEFRRQRIVQLEADKAELLESFAGTVPQRTETLSGETRHLIYKKLKLRVAVGAQGRLEEAQGVFINRVCTNERTYL